MLTNLFDFLRLFEARRVCIDEEKRCALGALAGIGNGGDDHEIGMNAVGDENLRSIEHPLIAVPNSIRPNSLYV